MKVNSFCRILIILNANAQLASRKVVIILNIGYIVFEKSNNEYNRQNEHTFPITCFEYDMK